MALEIPKIRSRYLTPETRLPAPPRSFGEGRNEQQIKRGAHRSVAELEAAITAYIKIRNAAPKPFRWTKSADAILASIERFCHRTLDTHAKCA